MRAAPLALALLAACAARAPQPAPEPAPAPPVAVAPNLAVTVPAPASIAGERVERLAVVCWLDDELAAAQMVVDRQTGAIVAVSADRDLLRIALEPDGPLATRVMLEGPALSDPARAGRMEDALSRVLEGETPAC